MDIGVFLDKQKKMGTGYIHILQSSNGKIASSKIAVKRAYVIAGLLVWGAKYHDFANLILLFLLVAM